MKNQMWKTYLIVCIPLIVGAFSYFYDMKQFDLHPEYSASKTMVYLKLVGFLALSLILYFLMKPKKEDQ